MKKIEFLEKVKRERIYDTKKYRYVCIDTGHTITIERIERVCLDTMQAFSEWEIVYTEFI